MGLCKEEARLPFQLGWYHPLLVQVEPLVAYCNARLDGQERRGTAFDHIEGGIR